MHAEIRMGSSIIGSAMFVAVISFIACSPR
jgi:hypothetical protein